MNTGTKGIKRKKNNITKQLIMTAEEFNNSYLYSQRQNEELESFDTSTWAFTYDGIVSIIQSSDKDLKTVITEENLSDEDAKIIAIGIDHFDLTSFDRFSDVDKAYLVDDLGITII